MDQTKSDVRYLHIPSVNVTIKFVLEDGQWVCRASGQFLDIAEERLNNQMDDLK